MIFTTWFSAWVVAASSVMGLVFPIVALMTRSAYLNRAFLRRQYFLTSAIFFVWVFLASQNGVAHAALAASQVLAFLFLTGHLVAGTQELRMNKLPHKVAMYKHLSGRYLRIINERLEDTFYSAKVRVKVSAISSSITQSFTYILYKTLIGVLFLIIGLVFTIKGLTSSSSLTSHILSFISIELRINDVLLGALLALLGLLLIFSTRLSTLKIIVYAFASAIVEIVTLRTQLSMIINSRGSFAHPQFWKLENSKRPYYVLGDLALLALVLAFVTVGPEKSVPQPIRSTLEATKTEIEKLVGLRE